MFHNLKKKKLFYVEFLYLNLIKIFGVIDIFHSLNLGLGHCFLKNRTHSMLSGQRWDASFGELSVSFV